MNTVAVLGGSFGNLLVRQYAMTGPASGGTTVTFSNGTGRTIVAMRVQPVSNATDAEFLQVAIQDGNGTPLPTSEQPFVAPLQTGSSENTPIGLGINPSVNNQAVVSGLTASHTYYLFVWFERGGSRSTCP